MEKQHHAVVAAERRFVVWSGVAAIKLHQSAYEKSDTPWIGVSLLWMRCKPKGSRNEIVKLDDRVD